MRTSITLILLCLFINFNIFQVHAQDTGEDISIGKSYTFESDVLEETRPYLVYLPTGYEENGDPVSVIYLLDGQGHFHHTTGIVQFLRNQGKIPNMMVVAIPNTNDRTRDLTPKIEKNKEALEQMPTAGGADKMLSFIKDELIPHINGNYNTGPYKLLVGHSFGGIFAVNALLSEPDLFDSYISISPSMWWDDQNLVDKAETFLEENKELDCFFYMTMGNEDGPMLGGAMKLAALFEEYENENFGWDFKVMDEETHGSIPHRSTYKGLEAIFEDWYSVDLATLYAIGGFEGIDEHYRMISKKLGYTMKSDEISMNNLGYLVMNKGDLDGAIKIFQKNVADYPQSFNVWDSAGEAYMNNGDKEKAIKYYKKSMVLNPGNANGVNMLKKLGVEYDPSEFAVNLDESEQKKYVGEYEVSVGGVLSIKIEDGALTASHPAIPKQTLLYYSNDTFMLSPENVPMNFTSDEEGNITEFLVQLGIGATVKGKKQ